MKWWLLNKVADEINKNNYIFSLCRAGDNLFWLGLDVSGGFLFDLENKNVLISEKRPTTKSYSATIDVWLAKNCNKAKILNANVKERDKILEINIEAHSGYKIERFTLRFEFIPPKGAFIILQNNVVLCALRYDERIKIKNLLSEPAPMPRAPDRPCSRTTPPWSTPRPS